MLKRIWNKIPERPTWRIFHAVLAFVFIAIVAFQAQINSIKGGQTDARDRGYINRAENCKTQLALGVELGSGCLDPNVTPLYDLTAAPVAGVRSEGQVINRRLLCLLVVAVGAVDPACEEM